MNDSVQKRLTAVAVGWLISGAMAYQFTIELVRLGASIQFVKLLYGVALGGLILISWWGVR